MVKTSQILKELQTKLAELEAKSEKLEARNEKLEARILQLEAPLPTPVNKPAPAPVVLPKDESINEEIMLVIAAAVAAYLGERAHIRVVRLLASTAWAQQGRVSIQASHRL